MRPDQRREPVPVQGQRDCKYGNNCHDFKRGECRYIHNDLVENFGSEEEKASDISQSNRNQYNFRGGRGMPSNLENNRGG